MKCILALLLAAALALLPGCGAPAAQPAEAPSPAPEPDPCVLTLSRREGELPLRRCPRALRRTRR